MEGGCLEEGARLLLSTATALSTTTAGLAGLGADDAGEGLVKDVLETLAGESGALEELEGAELLDHGVCLLLGDGGLALLAHALEGGLVCTKIRLGSDDDHGDVGAVVLDLFCFVLFRLACQGQSAHAHANASFFFFFFFCVEGARHRPRRTSGP